MATYTNLKYTNSPLNYYIMVVQNLKKKLKNREFPNFFAFRGTNCRVKANNNREAVVVCARYVVKRPSKRCAIVYIYIALLTNKVVTLDKEPFKRYVDKIPEILTPPPYVTHQFFNTERMGMSLFASPFPLGSVT